MSTEWIQTDLQSKDLPDGLRGGSETQEGVFIILLSYYQACGHVVISNLQMMRHQTAFLLNSSVLTVQFPELPKFDGSHICQI